MDVAEICNRLSDVIMENVSKSLSGDEIELLSSLLQRVFACIPKVGDVSL
jgi:hypothetical protein